MTNARIADSLDEIADLLEFQGANAFRVRAYRNSARSIRDYPESLATLVTQSRGKLTDIDGIGKDLGAKIETLIQTERLPQLEELRLQVPESVLALLRIPGLGPKKAAALHKELGVQSLDDLQQACVSHRVRDLKRFGAKTESMIVEGLAYARSTTSELRLYWSDADQIVRELLAHLRKVQSIEQLEMAGSYRRGKETVGDLDVLVVAADAKAVMDQFAAFPPVASTLVRGDTKMSVRLQGGFQIDLRVVPAESFGAALQYFTGSKEHNVIVRGRAKQMGLKVNEWGVFRVEGERETYVAGRNEQEVYEALGLPEFPPEMREARHEFAWAETGDLPVLITVDDIQGDLHMHTTATDGKNSIEEMAAAARARGLTYIAITDHSKRVSMANGLDGERLLAQWEEIDRVRQGLGKGITLLKGVECDILEKGGLDLPDEVLAQADWVMASIHYGQKQSQAQITGRILDAIAHPSVSAISHPTGRLINKREAYQVDIEAVMRQAAEHRKLLELNAHPTRLDLHDIHCAMAKEHGVPIVISTDAHSIEGLDVMKFGILQARRAGLTQDDVANTRTWPKVKQLLSRR